MSVRVKDSICPNTRNQDSHPKSAKGSAGKLKRKGSVGREEGAAVP